MILKIAKIVSLAAFGFSAITHGITLLLPNFAEQSSFAIFICFPLSVAGTFWCIWQIDLWARKFHRPWFRPDQNKFIPPGWQRAKGIFRLYTLICFGILIMVTINPNLSAYSDGLIMKFTTLFTAWATLEAWLFFAFIAPNLGKPIRWYSDIKEK